MQADCSRQCSPWGSGFIHASANCNFRRKPLRACSSSTGSRSTILGTVTYKGDVQSLTGWLLSKQPVCQCTFDCKTYLSTSMPSCPKTLTVTLWSRPCNRAPCATEHPVPLCYQMRVKALQNARWELDAALLENTFRLIAMLCMYSFRSGCLDLRVVIPYSLCLSNNSGLYMRLKWRIWWMTASTNSQKTFTNSSVRSDIKHAVLDFRYERRSQAAWWCGE